MKVKIFTYLKKPFGFTTIFIVAALFTALLLRIYLLDRIPSGLSGDELIYVLNAKSFALTGYDLSGKIKPADLLLFKYPAQELQAELAYLVHLPFSRLFPLSILTAHLPFSLTGVLTVIIMFLLGKKLVNIKFGIITAIISAYNPWLFVSSRNSYDCNLTILFYLTGIYLLNINRQSVKLLSMLSFLLAFYSYIGTKILLIPIVLTTVIFNYISGPYKKRAGFNVLMPVVFSIIIVALYFLLLQNGGNNRLNEVISIKDILSLKTINTMIPKVGSFFSIKYLFLYGDQFFLKYQHGIFYIADFFLLISGVCWFIKNKLFLFIYISINILIGIIPQLLHLPSKDMFTPHIIISIPFLIFLISAGYLKILDDSKNSALNKIILLFITGIYFFNVAMFMKLYFYILPLQDIYDMKNIIASRYIDLSSENNSVFIYTNDKTDFYKKFIFYTDSLTENTKFTIQNALSDKKFILKNVNFLSCNNNIDPAKINSTIIYDSICGKLISSGDHLQITSPSDGGIKYYIFNDNVCSEYNLPEFVYNINLTDLKITTLSEELFCKKFISRIVNK